MDLEQLKERYLALFPEDRDTEKQMIDQKVIEEMEQRLSVRLPDDFRRIAAFTGGSTVGSFSPLPYELSYPENLVGRTLELRSTIGLPHRFIPITEPDEGFIVLDTEPEPGGPQVIWIDAVEAETLATGDFDHEPDVWPTFADFFAECLEEEERTWETEDEDDDC